MVVDKDGRLHAFWVESGDSSLQRAGPETIVHTSYDDGNWQNPIDIIVAPQGGIISDIAVVCDEANHIRIAFLDSARPFYTSASASECNDAKAWIQARLVHGGTYSSVALLCAEHSLVLGLARLYAPHDLVVLLTEDYVSWFDPITVSEVPFDEEAAADVRLASGPSGELYAVWAQYSLPTGYPPLRIMFAGSEDGGHTWSEPLELDNGEYGKPAVAVTADGAIVVAYNGAAGLQGRYSKYSGDSGRSWSERSLISSGIGGLTGTALAVDSAQTVHFVSAGDTPPVNGVAYAHFRSLGWSEVANIVGPRGTPADGTRAGFEPWVTVVGGNEVHVCFIGPGHDGIFHTSTTSNAPPVTPPTNDSRSPIREAEHARSRVPGSSSPTSRASPSGTVLAGQSATDWPTRSATHLPVLAGVLPVAVGLAAWALRSLRPRAKS